jgi:hypothetical protein
MRSYSSVLSHVLGSHAEICGYAEMHQAYRTLRDLLRVRVRVARSLGGQLDGRFVLDKVLHDGHPIDQAMLERGDVHPIFVVRRPTETIESILALGARAPEIDWLTDRGAVADYYAQRITTLGDLAGDMRSPALVIPAESIVGRTEDALAAIEGFLGLAAPIDPSYRTFEHTGELRWGDVSERLASGRLERSGPTNAAELPDDDAGRAYRAFRQAAAANPAVTTLESAV